MHIYIKTLLFCLMTKNSIMIDQISKDIKEYNGVKFSLGLSLHFFKAQRHGEQSAVLDGNNVTVHIKNHTIKPVFYNEQVAYIERWIENFTNQKGTGAAISSV